MWRRRTLAGLWISYATGETEWAATWDYTSAHGTGVPLYVLFLLDSPGSMDDEIERIKEAWMMR